MHHKTGSGRSSSVSLMLAAILLMAANLRAPITALPPLLANIQHDYGLSNSAAGALTALPLLAFAVLSPISARVSLWLGVERTLLLALVAIVSGIALRSIPGQLPLFIGTSIIGMGIAAGNVLLPSLIKRDFPQHIAAITGAYALTMGLAAALGSALVVPLASQWGWQTALLLFLLLPVTTLVIWCTTYRQTHDTTRTHSSASHPLPWRSPLAWHITLFLGLNSTIYYIAIAWLPTIFTTQGLSDTQAGSLHGVMQLATAIPGLLLSPLLRRLPDQRIPAMSVALLSALSLLGWLYLPALAVLWSVLFGIGTGAGIILGLSFIGMRTHGPEQAARLSGMSQCIGYLLAAAGPILIAQLHDKLQSWLWPLWLCAGLAVLAAYMGYLAGRNTKLPA